MTLMYDDACLLVYHIECIHQCLVIQMSLLVTNRNHRERGEGTGS